LAVISNFFSEVLKVAMQKLGAGKRSLLVLDFSEAVSSLGEACQLLGQHFGETAKECGEPYFLYGKALLDLARAEAGVIDNGLDGGKMDFLLAIFSFWFSFLTKVGG
jgi:hypothetical protein